MTKQSGWWTSPWFWAVVVALLPVAGQLIVTRRDGPPLLHSPEFGLAISADGRRLACTPAGEGGADLVVRSLPDGATLFAARTPELELAPAFSPDGQQLLFARARGEMDGAALWLLDVATGTQRRLTRGGRWNDSDPCFAADGRTLVFVRRKWRSRDSVHRFSPCRLYTMVVGGRAEAHPLPECHYLLSPQFVEAGPWRGHILVGMLRRSDDSFRPALVDSDGQLSWLPGLDDATGVAALSADGSTVYCRVRRKLPPSEVIQHGEPGSPGAYTEDTTFDLVRFDVGTGRREVLYRDSAMPLVAEDRLYAIDGQHRLLALPLTPEGKPSRVLEEPLSGPMNQHPRALLPRLF